MCTVLRADLPRLSRATSIVTASASSPIKRSKPLKYAYEKEIVLYAHHKKLDYFSTECIYSPEAFRGSARALIKNLERIRPSAILDVVRSGEDMAKLVPAEVTGRVPQQAEEDGMGGCGSADGRSSGGEMADVERMARASEAASNKESSETAVYQEVEITDDKPQAKSRPRKQPRKQQMGQCQRCGYLSSQDICKACSLLEGLNKSKPRTQIDVASDAEEMLTRRMNSAVLVDSSR